VAKLSLNQILHNLVVMYLSGDLSFEDADIKPLLRSLPVWPSKKSPLRIAASTVLAIRTPGILVPWIKDYERFIDQRDFSSYWKVLKKLDVDETPAVQILRYHILPNLPEKVLDVSSYGLLIRAIPLIADWRKALETLRQSKLAPDKAGRLCLASKLFDHTDELFKSAFRKEAEARFLLKETEDCREFWLDVGLRHRVNGQFIPEDYVLCLRTMRQRLKDCKDLGSDPNISADASKVLKPLVSASTALGHCSKNDWSNIAREATFIAETDFVEQPAHRREAMTLLATAIPLLQLSETIAPKYMSVCWSQTSFPLFRPTPTTFAELPSEGKPSIAMVWKHLEHMASSVTRLEEDTVASFLADLHESYGYLQDHLNESKMAFTAYQNSEVWLNLETTDPKLVRKADLQSSWSSIEHLILDSSCDTKNLKSVGQGLIRYRNLLRELGCKSIVYPKVVIPESGASQSLSRSLSHLRREGKLLDVTLVASGGSVGAHRIVLAAASVYFAKRFSGDWSSKDSIPLNDFSHSTMSTVVEFAYSDTFHWTEMQPVDGESVDSTADKLDELLDLLTAADFFAMPELIAQVEKAILTKAHTFIREHNVLGVRNRASDANAHLVKGYCNKYYEANKQAVDQASEN
jgi:sacsin